MRWGTVFSALMLFLMPLVPVSVRTAGVDTVCVCTSTSKRERDACHHTPWRMYGRLMSLQNTHSWASLRSQMSRCHIKFFTHNSIFFFNHRLHLERMNESVSTDQKSDSVHLLPLVVNRLHRSMRLSIKFCPQWTCRIKSSAFYWWLFQWHCLIYP